MMQVPPDSQQPVSPPPNVFFPFPLCNCGKVVSISSNPEIEQIKY